MSPPRGKNTRAALDRLLEQRNEHPERLAELDAEIWQAFGETHAVWVLDMCGFSRLTVRYGITHFLAMIHRLRGIVRPLIERRGGTVIKTEADNVFATFPDVTSAALAARDVQRQLATANVFLPADWDLHASIGIGYGQLLMIEEHDFYGTELNLASKLGEDVAGPGEILLTEMAYTVLRADPSAPSLTLERQDIAVSNMTVAAYKLLDGAS